MLLQTPHPRGRYKSHVCPPRHSPVTWDIAFSTHSCTPKTHIHTPLPEQAHAHVRVTRPHTPLHPVNAPPSHTEAHSYAHVTHAHPPPNTTHRSSSTCAPSELPVLRLSGRSHRSLHLRRPPPSQEDCAAQPKPRERCICPIHPPAPAPAGRLGGGPCGRSAPRRSTRGCPSLGPLLIGTASHQEQGRG